MEKDMYPIIQSYLINQGYDVKAEVMHADIVAKKDDVILIVEMKTALTTSLIYQGLKREHLTDYVYLAIPRPTTKVLRSTLFHEKKTIIRRLELGLMLVDMKHQSIDILFDPETYHLKKQEQKKQKLLKEFQTRKTSLNIGGVTKTKIITVYKEKALMILEALKDGPKSTADLKRILNDDHITSILQKNYYGWYERLSRGVYQITGEGLKARTIYEEVISTILNEQLFSKT